MNLNAYYNSVLAKIKVNLVALANELKLFNFLVLMFLKVSQREFKPQGARQLLTWILDSFNKILEVLKDEFLDALPPYKEVDHKIEVVFGMAPLSKAPYRLN